MTIKNTINRRKFVSISATGATAIILSTSVLADTLTGTEALGKKDKSDTKDIFKKCGTCSQTYYYLLNREFKNEHANREKASDLLAGGLMRGYQCGMLWGSALAVGTEAYKRYNDKGVAMSSAISSTGMVMDSFAKRAGSVNCRDITHCNLEKKSGMMKMMLKIIFQGGLKNSTCFRLADQWAPEAIQTAGERLSVKPLDSIKTCCASELVSRMGGSDEESTVVAGLSGGMGLRGYACGALGAAIWMKSLAWCKNNPGESPYSKLKDTISRTYDKFYAATDSKVLCAAITGTSFSSLGAHSDFIARGGCDKILNALCTD